MKKARQVMRDVRVEEDENDRWAPIVPVNHPLLRTNQKEISMTEMETMSTPTDWRDWRSKGMHVFPVEAMMSNELAQQIHRVGCKASRILRVQDDEDDQKTVQVIYVLDY